MDKIFTDLGSSEPPQENPTEALTDSEFATPFSTNPEILNKELSEDFDHIMNLLGRAGFSQDTMPTELMDEYVDALYRREKGNNKPDLVEQIEKEIFSVEQKIADVLADAQMQKAAEIAQRLALHSKENRVQKQIKESEMFIKGLDEKENGWIKERANPIQLQKLEDLEIEINAVKTQIEGGWTNKGGKLKKLEAQKANLVNSINGNIVEILPKNPIRKMFQTAASIAPAIPVMLTSMLGRTPLVQAEVTGAVLSESCLHQVQNNTMNNLVSLVTGEINILLHSESGFYIARESSAEPNPELPLAIESLSTAIHEISNATGINFEGVSVVLSELDLHSNTNYSCNDSSELGAVTIDLPTILNLQSENPELRVSAIESIFEELWHFNQTIGENRAKWNILSTVDLDFDDGYREFLANFAKAVFRNDVNVNGNEYFAGLYENFNLNEPSGYVRQILTDQEYDRFFALPSIENPNALDQFTISNHNAYVMGFLLGLQYHGNIRDFRTAEQDLMNYLSDVQLGEDLDRGEDLAISNIIWNYIGDSMSTENYREAISNSYNELYRNGFIDSENYNLNLASVANSLFLEFGTLRGNVTTFPMDLFTPINTIGNTYTNQSGFDITITNFGENDNFEILTVENGGILPTGRNLLLWGPSDNVVGEQRVRLGIQNHTLVEDSRIFNNENDARQFFGQEAFDLIRQINDGALYIPRYQEGTIIVPITSALNFEEEDRDLRVLLGPKTFVGSDGNTYFVLDYSSATVFSSDEHKELLNSAYFMRPLEGANRSSEENFVTFNISVSNPTFVSFNEMLLNFGGNTENIRFSQSHSIEEWYNLINGNRGILENLIAQNINNPRFNFVDIENQTNGIISFDQENNITAYVSDPENGLRELTYEELNEIGNNFTLDVITYSNAQLVNVLTITPQQLEEFPESIREALVYLLNLDVQFGGTDLRVTSMFRFNTQGTYFSGRAVPSGMYVQRSANNLGFNGGNLSISYGIDGNARVNLSIPGLETTEIGEYNPEEVSDIISAINSLLINQ